MHVLLTRHGSERTLAAELREAGVRVEEVELLRFEPLSLSAADRARIQDPNAFAWVAVTSREAVRAFERALRDCGLSWRTLEVPVAAGGESTARELSILGKEAELVADPPGARSLAASLSERLVEPGQILFPCAESPRPEFEQTLRERGHSVHPIALYRTRLIPEALQAWRPEDPMDWVVVVRSPSAFEAFRRGWSVHPASRRGTPRFVAGGPTTAASVRSAGASLLATARSPEDAGLLEALVEHAREEP